MNKSFRTGIHRDYNRLNAYSVMVIAGEFSGGELVFPEYNIACDLRAGDMIIFDSAMYHGNSSMRSSSIRPRVSFVLYQV